MANVSGAQAGSAAAVQPALTSDAARRKDEPAHKSSGYGLPCAKCHLYYSADLDFCPTCHHTERVSPVVPKILAKSVQDDADPVPDIALVEQEREEFLRQFKSQLMEAHAGLMDAPEAICKFAEHHPGEQAPADVCIGCY